MSDWLPYTKLYLEGVGANNSTNIIDSSYFNKTTFSSANTLIKTDVKKTGTGSMYFAGDGYARYAPSDKYHFDLGIDTFTIDFWVNPDRIIGQFGVWGWYRSATTYFNIYIDDDEVRAFSYIGSVTGINATSLSGYITSNNWHHIALVRRADYGMKIFIDGIDRTDSTAGWGNDLDAYEGSTYYYFGACRSSIWRYFDGYIDQFRLIKGKALWWDSPFTPPVVYPISGNLNEDAKVTIIDETSGLVEFEDNFSEGSWVAYVSSGNKTVIAKKINGDTKSYGGVSPIIT